MINPSPTTHRPSVIQLAIKEKAALYAAYIPLFADGGIFIPTTRDYKLGDDVYVLLSLPDDPQRYPVAGKVAWITPARAAANIQMRSLDLNLDGSYDSFEFDQIVVPNAQGADWRQLLTGRVRQGLTKADELAPVAAQELIDMPDAMEFLIARRANGYQVALVETFGGSPNTALAGAVNDELAVALRAEFLDSPSDVAFLLHPDAPRRQWSADYLANSIPPGSARINLYFVKALPVECF